MCKFIFFTYYGIKLANGALNQKPNKSKKGPCGTGLSHPFSFSMRKIRRKVDQKHYQKLIHDFDGYANLCFALTNNAVLIIKRLIES